MPNPFRMCILSCQNLSSRCVSSSTVFRCDHECLDSMNWYMCLVKSLVNGPIAMPIEIIWPAILEISFGVAKRRVWKAFNECFNFSNFWAGTEKSICLVLMVKPKNMLSCAGTNWDFPPLMVSPACRRSACTAFAMCSTVLYPWSPKIPSSR